ncbi:hypothetical protein NDU88_008233 [Pleurodeles waltl]|uniref:Uncharacterized protein n=1 Tax=Pleurodeles waltl TaxID=8319 RepID=A0AAV7RX25_PLEWA|nr:hypothetical protein NDU88_008233 [Pleurodeles waltl]
MLSSVHSALSGCCGHRRLGCQASCGQGRARSRCPCYGARSTRSSPVRVAGGRVLRSVTCAPHSGPVRAGSGVLVPRCLTRNRNRRKTPRSCPLAFRLPALPIRVSGGVTERKIN